jgi:hypothetical protein
MGLVTLTLVVWALSQVGKGSPGYEVENYRDLPGVYFEHLGRATLSNTVWTIIQSAAEIVKHFKMLFLFIISSLFLPHPVVYAQMQPTDEETTGLERYVQYIEATCSRITIRNWTACSHFSESMTYRLQRIRPTRQSLVDVVQKGYESVRSKRRLFNFVGTASKALFGIIDDNDAQLYHEQIERFEQGTTTLTQLVKHQLIIVRLTLGTLNGTLTDIVYNEAKMREGLGQLRAYFGTFGEEVENATYLLSLKITMEHHIARALDAAQVVQRAMDIRVDDIVEAQKGFLTPRVMSPSLLLDQPRFNNLDYSGYYN